MPTYEYQCQVCKYNFEEFQKISALPLEKCPKCGSKIRRIISAGGGFLFKGNGFYTTDYRSSEYKKKAKEEKGLVSKPVEKSKTEKK
jgi:putative FmdB family regulatory protein